MASNPDCFRTLPDVSSSNARCYFHDCASNATLLTVLVVGSGRVSEVVVGWRRLHTIVGSQPCVFRVCGHRLRGHGWHRNRRYCCSCRSG
jgi:hypothetical protein